MVAGCCISSIFSFCFLMLSAALGSEKLRPGVDYCLLTVPSSQVAMSVASDYYHLTLSQNRNASTQITKQAMSNFQTFKRTVQWLADMISYSCKLPFKMEQDVGCS